jgi:hypothetical protein
LSVGVRVVAVVALHDDEWCGLKSSDVGISTVMDSKVYEIIMVHHSRLIH